MPTPPRLVIVESPYAGDTAANVNYARRCVRDCIERGEAPIASHLLFTQPGILDDADPEDRRRGIEAGLAWLRVADLSVVYRDRGLSNGMKQGIAAARAAGVPVETRELFDKIPAVDQAAFAGRPFPDARVDQLERSRDQWRESAHRRLDLLAAATQDLRDLRQMVHAVDWNNIPARDRLAWRDKLDAVLRRLGGAA